MVSVRKKKERSNVGMFLRRNRRTLSIIVIICSSLSLLAYSMWAIKMIQSSGFSSSSSSSVSTIASSIERSSSQFLSNSQKPTLLLHVGPPKTGTTYLQHAVLAMNNDIFMKDSYYYLGKVNKESFIKMRFESDFIRMALPASWKNLHAGWVSRNNRIQTGKQKLKEELSRHLKLNHNIIISAEEFGDLAEYVVSDEAGNEIIDGLREIFDGFDVKIVVVYRRLHEWLISAYDFHNRPQWYNKEIFEAFPDNGGVRITSIQTHIERNKSGHPAITCIKGFEKLGPPILINLEAVEANQLGKGFACSIPNAPESCSFFTNEYTHKAKQNAANKSKDRMEIEFSRMSQTAYLSGLVSRQHRKVDLTNLIKSQWEELGLDTDFHELVKNKSVPLKCLDVTNLLTESLEAEKSLLPSFYESKEGEQSLRASMTKMDSDGAFCNINVEKLFEREEWLTFFKEHKNVVYVKSKYEWEKLINLHKYNSENTPIYSENAGEKPSLILHVGPQKTGAEYLQHSVLAMNNEIFKEDNYYYLGKVNTESFSKMEFKFDYIRGALAVNWKNMHDGWLYRNQRLQNGKNRLKKELLKQLSNGHNVIISATEFSELARYARSPGGKEIVDGWKEIFDGFDVKIVVLYCRFHEWVLNAYNARNQLKWFQKERYEAWQDHGGVRISDLQEQYDDECKEGHPAISCINAFRELGSPILISFEEAEENQLGMNFACAIPNAPNACNHFTDEYLQNKNEDNDVSTSKPDVRMEIEFSRMAQKAHSSGIISDKHEKVDVIDQIKAQWKSLGLSETLRELARDKSFPLDCLDGSELQEYSLTADKVLSSSLYKSNGGEQSLRDSMEKMEGEGSFCNVNTAELFSRNEWQKFFQDHLS